MICGTGRVLWAIASIVRIDMGKIKIFLLFILVAALLSGCMDKNGSDKELAYNTMKNQINKNKSANICIISAVEHDEIWQYSAGASGVIVGCDQDGYYALTAYHVINKENAKFLIMTVFDEDVKEDRKEHNRITDVICEYYNSFPVAKVVYTNEQEDLAIIYFETRIKLEIVSLSEKNPKKDDLVITVGSYSEKMDYFFVSTGMIDKDELVTFKTNDGNAENRVLQHSAFTTEGFSGGGVYDEDMKLVGINIGGGVDFFGRFKFSVMIPCEQINKCIEKSNINELQDI